MRVAREAVVEQPHVFVQHRVTAQLAAKFVQLSGGGQLSVNQQVGHFNEIAITGQLLDRITAVTENSPLAIEEGNRTGGGTSVHVPLIQCDVAGFAAQLGNVDSLFVF